VCARPGVRGSRGGGGLQADDVRTRQSGLTTHGRQDVRTRQSGITTPASPLRAEECRGHRNLSSFLKGLSSGLLAVRTRPSGLKTPATPLRAEECRGWSLYQGPLFRRRTPGRRRAHTPECRGVSRVHKPFIRRSLRACL